MTTALNVFIESRPCDNGNMPRSSHSYCWYQHPRSNIPLLLFTYSNQKNISLSLLYFTTLTEPTNFSRKFFGLYTQIWER